MKTSFAAVLLAITLPVCAQASSPQPIPFVVQCAHPVLPTQADVARFTGVDNFAQLYATRTRLMQQAGRECRRGVAQVTLVMQQAGSDKLPGRRFASTQGTP